MKTTSELPDALFSSSRALAQTRQTTLRVLVEEGLRRVLSDAQITARPTFKPWRRRVLHAGGFEGGLVVLLVPLIAWWLNTSLWIAFVADLGVLVFFFVYAFIFTWVFDRLFGLPASAR